jgi:ABC-2 type transport system permease protein
VFQRTNLRADVTAEGLSQITKPTQELIAGITVERPVVIHAYVSKEVPREYVAVRSRLLTILREMQARGGAGLTVRILEPEPFSPEAQEAVDNYGISPQGVTSREAGRVQQLQVFLGVAFVSGPHEEVIPFLDRGLSPEYEIVRALRTVTQEKKKVVGVLRTDATIMGNFDLQARRQQPAWRVIAELRKQYEVRSLNPGAEIPADVDVLLVPQLSSMTTPQLEFVAEVHRRRAPRAADRRPAAAVRHVLSPSEPMKPPPGMQQNMFGPPPGASPRATSSASSQAGRRVGPVEDRLRHRQPAPRLRRHPPHVVFVGKRPDGTDPFAGGDPVIAASTRSSCCSPASCGPPAGHEAEFVPLLSTGTRGGFNKFEEMVRAPHAVRPARARCCRPRTMIPDAR